MKLSLATNRFAKNKIGFVSATRTLSERDSAQRDASDLRAQVTELNFEVNALSNSAA